jgi:hypothetical protein
MASITKYKTASGEQRWRVQYRAPDNKLTGARGFTTKKQAENYAATVTVSKFRGEYIDPADARVTVGDLGPDWLARRAHLKPSSGRVEEVAWRVHVEPKWGKVRLADLRHSAIQSWVSSLGREVKAADGTVTRRARGPVTVRPWIPTPTCSTGMPRRWPTPTTSASPASCFRQM